MNTKEDTSPKQVELGDFNADNQNSQSKDIVETKLRAAEAQIRNERFVFFLVYIVILDCYIFTLFEHWSGPICITILEILIAMIVARLYGLKEVELIIDKFLPIFSFFVHRKK